MIAAAHHSMMQRAGGGLPSSYTEVEYIYPSAAGAYIDLGWHPTTWTAFDAYLTIAPLRKANFGVSNVTPTSTNSSQILNLGFSLVDNWANDRWLGFAQSGTYEWSNNFSTSSQYNNVRNNIHHHYVDLAAYLARTNTGAVADEYSLDDSLVQTGFWDRKIPSGIQEYSAINRNVFLFALNNNGSAVAAGVSKMGRLRFYTTQGDAAYFIPCVDSSLNAGMFNLVSQTFHGAAAGTILYQSLT